jgi:hypothetical protein
MLFINQCLDYFANPQMHEWIKVLLVSAVKKGRQN